LAVLVEDSKRDGNDRFAKSRALYERAKRSLAGGVSSQFRVFNVIHPMFYARAAGSRVWDVDGNELIDFTLSQGPCILGHSHPEMLERVGKALAQAQLFAGQHEDELQLAETLQRMIPCAERVRFGSSGSEAAHAVLRLARFVTRRPKFIKFEGQYHGWFDSVSFNVAPPASLANDPTRPQPWGGGIPDVLAEDVVPLPWNDLALVRETLERQGHEIGAIITEPVMCNQGCIEPKPGFLQGLRALCDQYDVALIFDEIITGFRLDLSGAQGYYGVTPDLALFGKALGSGFPLSAIVGKERFMSPLERGEVYHAGTLNGNNGCVAAALATIDILERDDRAAHRHIVRMGKMLRDGLADLAARSPLPIRIQGPGPMFHMGFTRRDHVTEYRHVLDYDRALYQDFCRRLLLRGIRVIERGLWYVSAAHSEEDVRLCLKTAEDVLNEMASG
jgi:glutamate-1-semialdehyde 2,1-aminomutase